MSRGIMLSVTPTINVAQSLLFLLSRLHGKANKLLCLSHLSLSLSRFSFLDMFESFEKLLTATHTDLRLNTLSSTPPSTDSTGLSLHVKCDDELSLLVIVSLSWLVDDGLLTVPCVFVPGTLLDLSTTYLLSKQSCAFSLY